MQHENIAREMRKRSQQGKKHAPSSYHLSQNHVGINYKKDHNTGREKNWKRISNEH
jgi:hypothetical protein